jgi:hypothetical protein
MRIAQLTDNSVMTSEQRDIVLQTKSVARRHLQILVSDPDLYLRTFKYAMDFVWAKCAFSFLLLLKLALLLPDDAATASDNPHLLADGDALLRELAKVQAPHNIYYRIIGLSLDLYKRTLCHADVDDVGVNNGSNGIHTATPEQHPARASSSFLDSYDAQTDFQSYVPEEFVFEWDFPGLTFSYFPTAFQNIFSDLVDWF